MGDKRSGKRPVAVRWIGKKPIRRAGGRIARALHIPRRAFFMISRVIGAVIGFGLLAAAGLLVFLSQTVVGRNAVAALVEDVLNGAVNGVVRLGPIIGGDLISGVTVAHFEIATYDGDVFLSMDSVRVGYNPLSFLRQSYRIRRAHIETAEINLIQYEDGSWIMDRLFVADDSVGAGGARILFADVQIESGRLRMRTPWAMGLSGAERDSVIEAGLRGEALWRVLRTDSGTVERVIELDEFRGRFPLIRIADPRWPMKFEIEGVTTVASIVQEQLDILRFDGTATFRDSVLVDIETVRFPASTLRGSGHVIPSDPPTYRFSLRGDPIGFTDLQWLPFPVPPSGGGTMDIVLWAGEDEIPVVEATNGDVRVDDSHIVGRFVVAIEPTPRFDSIDLELSPLRLAMLDELLERPSLIDGYLVGSLTGSGPMDGLNIDAPVRLRGVTDTVAPSFVHLQGGVSMLEPFPMDSLHLRFEAFEPRWTRVVGIDTDLGGRVSGTTMLDGRADGPLGFALDLYLVAGGDSSHLSGDGRVDLVDESFVDVRFNADPLALSLFRPYVSEIELVGEIRGPMSATGHLSDLHARARLQTPRGEVEFDGVFDLEDPRKRYDALVIARDLQLEQWIAGAPNAVLDIRGRIDGSGTELATLDARFDLEILPSQFEGVLLDTGLVRFTLADGLATADTFVIRSDVADAVGRGTFGLADDKRGVLILELAATDLASWNRWLVAGRNVSRPDTVVDDLFVDFPAARDAAAGGDESPHAAPVDTLAGSLTARGVVFGTLSDFSLGGLVQARELTYGDHSADSVRMTLEVHDPKRPDSAVQNATAWEVGALGQRFDSTRVRWQRLDSVRSDLTLLARRDTSVALDAHARLGWTAAEKSAQIDDLRFQLGDQRIVLSDTARVAYGDSGLVVRNLELSGPRGGRFQADGDIPPEGEARFQLTFEDLRIRNERWLWPGGPDLGGLMDGSLTLGGTAAAPRMQGRVEIERPAVDTVAYERVTTEFDYADRTLNLDLAIVAPRDTVLSVMGKLGVDLAFEKREKRLLDEAIDLTVRADSMPLQLVELMFDNLRDVAGYARGSVRIMGDPSDLEFVGYVDLVDGGATLPDLGIRLSGITDQLAFQGTEARLDSLSVTSSAGGFATVSGSVDFETPTDIGYDLDMRANRFGAVRRRTMVMFVNGNAHLGGSYSAPDLTGSFRLSDGFLRADQFFRDRSVVDLSDPEVMQLIDTTLVSERRLIARAQNPFMQNLRMDAQVTIGPNLWMRSDQLEVDMAGELVVRMERGGQDMRVIGPLRLNRGRYRYEVGPYARNFKISGGTIDFVGNPGVNPNLDIRAAYETRGQRGIVLLVTLHVTGTMLEPTVSLSSDPPVAEADLICYVFFNSPCVSVTSGGPGGSDIGAQLARDQVLGTVSTSLSSVLVGETGLDYLDIRSAASARQYGTNTGSESFFSDTEIEIGKYLGRDVFVTVSQSLATSTPPSVRVEWQLGRDYTLVARTERYLSDQLIQTYSSFTTRQLIGLSLFREWSFGD